MTNSTKTPAIDKAALVAGARKFKAREGVPLMAHASGRWARKINQRVVFFGRITTEADYGSAAAVAEYHRTADDIRHGRTPRPKDAQVLSVEQACNAFLRHKKRAVDTGDMAPRTWSDYKATAGRIVRVFGRHRAVDDLRAADFDRLREYFAKTRGPVAVGNAVRWTRTIFRFCFEYELIQQPQAS